MVITHFLHLETNFSCSLTRQYHFLMALYAKEIIIVKAVFLVSTTLEYYKRFFHGINFSRLERWIVVVQTWDIIFPQSSRLFFDFQPVHVFSSFLVAMVCNLSRAIKVYHKATQLCTICTLL